MNIDFGVCCNNIEEILKLKEHVEEEPFTNFYDEQSNVLSGSQTLNNYTNILTYGFYFTQNYQFTFQSNYSLINYNTSETINQKNENNDLMNENLNFSFIIFEKINIKENIYKNKFKPKRYFENKFKKRNLLTFDIKFKFHNIANIKKSRKNKILIKFLIRLIFLKHYKTILNKYVSKEGDIKKNLIKFISINIINIYLENFQKNRKIRFKNQNDILYNLKLIIKNDIRTKFKQIILDNKNRIK